MSISIIVSGPAQKRSVSETETTRTSEVKTVTVRHTEEFTEPEEFHIVACKSSSKQLAKKILPDEYVVRTSETTTHWDATLNANASEITDFAEVVSEKDNMPVIEVLLIWLQNFGSQRIRRAIQSYLNTKHSIDIDPDGF